MSAERKVWIVFGALALVGILIFIFKPVPEDDGLRAIEEQRDKYARMVTMLEAKNSALASELVGLRAEADSTMEAYEALLRKSSRKYEQIEKKVSGVVSGPVPDQLRFWNAQRDSTGLR
jgi:hypothetical protein